MRLNTQNTPASAQSILLETQLRFVRYFSIMVITILSVVFIGLLLTSNLSPVGAVSFVTFAALYALLLILALQKRYTIFLINMVCVTILLSIVSVKSPLIVFAFAYSGMIVAAIFAHRIVFGASLFMFFASLALIFTRYPLTPEFYGGNIGFIGVLVILVSLSLFLRRFRYDIGLAVERSIRSSELLHASAEIAQITSTTLDLKDLFKQAVDLIRDRFAYYHVQIFLLDEPRESAVLVASTGEAGKQLIARGHKLAVGSQSVIGRVTQTGEPVIVRDIDNDEVHARNELLPNTRAELALPILDGDRIIGALDVQSTQRDTFDESDFQALQVISNQLATLIRNARLFEAQASAVQENKRLFFESEANLREIQRLNRQLSKNAWESYLRANRDSAGVTLSSQGILAGADWTQTMTEAATRQRPITRDNSSDDHDSQVIAVPIVLRGEVLGAIEVSPGIDLRQDDTVEMMQAVAQRLAISLDNARLFEEAQETTAQEQRINQIVGLYQAADSVDDLLQITLSELSEVLGAAQGAIRLGQTPAASNEPTNTKGYHNGAFKNSPFNGGTS